ncbi:unnamed protein product [Ixodes persulcatus]
MYLPSSKNSMPCSISETGRLYLCRSGRACTSPDCHLFLIYKKGKAPKSVGYFSQLSGLFCFFHAVTHLYLHVYLGYAYVVMFFMQYHVCLASPRGDVEVFVAQPCCQQRVVP